MTCSVNKSVAVTEMKPPGKVVLEGLDNEPCH